jgi:hypothetical protein
LLRGVRPILDSLPGRPAWRFGGGTGLAVVYAHRISYDIDIFLDRASDLKALTPARNEAIRSLIGARGFEFPGHYLKLNLDGGEIDFIVAATITDPATSIWSFEGHDVQLETPVEIAAKKISYRGSSFKVRDVFDLAVVIAHERDALDLALEGLRDKLPRLTDRVAKLEPVFAEQAAIDINVTRKGRRYLKDAPAVVLDYLRTRSARSKLG